jgi:dolichyl-phosphate-mannose--protein O-mannosyl transferase
MKIEVSNGEIIDKLTILAIKLIYIEDEKKIKNMQKEYDVLLPIVTHLWDWYPDAQVLHVKLQKINLILWNIEDKLREKEKDKSFDKEFIELARSVYKTNDERARIKKEINIVTLSDLQEEKSYQEYDN